MRNNSNSSTFLAFVSESFAVEQDSRGLESYTHSTKRKKITKVTETRKQFSAVVLCWGTQSLHSYSEQQDLAINKI